VKDKQSCASLLASSFEQSVQEGLATSRWEQFDHWVLVNGTFSGKKPYEDDGPFQYELFNVIVSLFKDALFLVSPNAYKVLKVLEDEWGRLSVTQSTTIVRLLTEYYVKFSDSMSRFLTVEILGEYCADENALEALKIIKQQSVGVQRDLIPMGFKCLVENTDDPLVKTSAMAELRAMVDDDSQAARSAAKEYISRLAIERS
jgi:hypothetical protein